MTKHKKNKKWYRLLFLHRFIGLSAAFFAILLSITGILLNHTEEFDLDSRKVSSSLVMELYGIKAPDIKRSFMLSNSGNHSANTEKKWVVEFAGSLYLDRQKLNCNVPLTGAIKTTELTIVSGQTHVCLFTHQAELVDSLAVEEGDSIRRLGKNAVDNIIVDTSAGPFLINADFTELVSWQGTAEDSIEWVLPDHPPDSLSTFLKQKHKGEGLPLERLILDLHSGRIFGLFGVYFMDLIAVLIIFLSITGFVMWVQRKLKRYKKKVAKVKVLI